MNEQLAQEIFNALENTAQFAFLGMTKLPRNVADVTHEIRLTTHQNENFILFIKRDDEA